MTNSLLYTDVLSVLGLQRFCAYCHNHCEFIHAVTLWYPEHKFPYSHLPMSCSYTFSGPSTKIIPELWEEVVWNICSILG